MSSRLKRLKIGKIENRRRKIGLGIRGSDKHEKDFEKNGEMVVHPLLNFSPNRGCHKMTGIVPRHRPHHLSLLPSGPDEVRDRLLRGGRSA